MPTYKVTAPGFYGDKYYHPEGKRQVLTTSKPFTKGAKSKNPMPSWLSDMPKESDALKKKREALEKAQAELDAEEAGPATPGTAAAALQQGVSTQEQVAVASSEGDGQDTSFLDKTKDSVVETI